MVQPMTSSRNGAAQSERPQVTVIVPCRNERAHIEQCLSSIASSRFPQDSLEILVIDGMSEDGTRAIVADFAQRHPHVRLLDNPRRVTPTALNIGIREARAEVIMRMDAHVLYPDAYIPDLLHWLKQSSADNVGGVCVTLPGGPGVIAAAIARAVSHPFGVGNSYFRIGTSKPRWVDTLAFGCYRRAMFEKIGMFDEEMVRNQDVEFNHRLIRSGGRILLAPEIKSYYYARTKLKNLWRMYWQYGYFNPLVLRKVGRVPTARQVVPSAFVGSLALAALAAPFSTTAAATLALIAGAYLLANLGASALTVRRGAVGRALVLPVAFGIIHFAYGLGFIKGLADFFVRQTPRPVIYAKVPLSR